MGTKLNPGKFDCYENAEPDEPMFILLARDPLAPILVDLWAELRSHAAGNPSKVGEAHDCAEAMRLWRADRQAHARAVDPRVRTLDDSIADMNRVHEELNAHRKQP